MCRGRLGVTEHEAWDPKLSGKKRRHARREQPGERCGGSEEFPSSPTLKGVVSCLFDVPIASVTMTTRKGSGDKRREREIREGRA